MFSNLRSGTCTKTGNEPECAAIIHKLKTRCARALRRVQHPYCSVLLKLPVRSLYRLYFLTSCRHNGTGGGTKTTLRGRARRSQGTLAVSSLSFGLLRAIVTCAEKQTPPRPGGCSKRCKLQTRKAIERLHKDYTHRRTLSRAASRETHQRARDGGGQLGSLVLRGCAHEQRDALRVLDRRYPAGGHAGELERHLGFTSTCFLGS